MGSSKKIVPRTQIFFASNDPNHSTNPLTSSKTNRSNTAIHLPSSLQYIGLGGIKRYRKHPHFISFHIISYHFISFHIISSYVMGGKKLWKNMVFSFRCSVKISPFFALPCAYDKSMEPTCTTRFAGALAGAPEINRPRGSVQGTSFQRPRLEQQTAVGWSSIFSRFF